MRRSQCGTGNAQDAEFCRKCGIRLTLLCKRCGRSLAPDAAFCDECGAPVAAGAPDGFTDAVRRLITCEFADRLMGIPCNAGTERRLLTILFSDPKGSTTLGERLNPEGLVEVMNSAFDFLIPPVYRYEGTPARLMGDAILAFFGASIAKEDDPERARRVAPGILAGAREHAARLQKQRDLEGLGPEVVAPRHETIEARLEPCVRPAQSFASYYGPLLDAVIEGHRGKPIRSHTSWRSYVRY